MNYLKMLGFYVLEVVGSTANLLGAIIGYYPRLELGVHFLLILEKKKIQGEDSRRGSDRESQLTDAKEKKEEAYALDGEDI